MRRTPYPPFVVERAEGRSAYPRIAGFLSGFAGAGQLEVGDRVIVAGSTDLAGAGPVAVASAFASSPPDTAIDLAYERNGRQGATKLLAPSYRRYWPRALASLTFGITALMLLYRGRPSPMVRAFVLTHASAAVFFACSFAGGTFETRASVAAHVASLALAAPLALRSALLFPHGLEPTTLTRRFGPWLFSVVAIFDASRFYDAPFPRAIGAVGSGILTVVYLIAALGILTGTYRRAIPSGRRQIRWILLGAYLGAAPPLLLSAFAAWRPGLHSAVAIAASSLAIIPLSQLIGISRFNFFDVDHLISHAASYTVLSVVLLGLFVGSTSSVAAPLGEATGLGAPLAQVVLVIAVVSALRPVARRLRPQLDRVLFPQRFALERGGAQLLDELSDCYDAKKLLELASARLEKLLGPLSLAVFVRVDERFEAAVARGVAPAEPISADDPLIAAVERVHVPISASTRAERARLAPFSRAVLETLGVPCVVPVRRAGQLFAFLCLGPKSSRDLYTSTDHALLAGVSQKMAAELDRYDNEQVLRASEALVERLRSYVGGPLFDRLGRGESPDVGQLEVSVLFLDLRGYSAFAEELPPDRVFSTMNRYTLAVSEVIERHAGALVEFDGDGMMAVFGAPEPLAEKERASVYAACEIVAAVARLSESEAGLRGVGVGIATGDAFVGSIRSAGRLFWTALGNTTNRAARLQALTREFEVSIVIDDATYTATKGSFAAFVRHDEIRIRGHRKAETLYSLRLPA